MRMVAKRVTSLAIVVVFGGLVSCGGGAESEPDLSLRRDDGAAGMAQLRRRQALRWKYEGATEYTEDPLATEGDPFALLPPDFEDMLVVECGFRAWVRDGKDPAAFGNTGTDCSLLPLAYCSELACGIEAFTCGVNLMLEVASQTTERTYHARTPAAPGGAAATVVVPVQDRATIAALEELAAIQAGTGALLVGGLGGLTVFSDPLAQSNCDAPFSGDAAITNAEVALTRFRELFELANESTELAVRDYVALADGFFSSAASTEAASASAFEVRRFIATSLTGTPELSPAITPALCATDRLTPEGQAALAMLREAALDPADVIAIADYPGFTGTAVPLVTVLDEAKRRVSSFHGDFGRVDGLSLDTFLAESGLRREDFTEARRFLTDEIHAFARSSTQLLPERRSMKLDGSTDLWSHMMCAGDGSCLYAGTSGRPVPPLPVHYSNTVRNRATMPTGVPTDLWGMPQAVVGVSASLIQVITDIEAAGMGAPSHGAAALPEFQRILDTIRDEWVGTLRTSRASGVTAAALVHDLPATDLVLVTTEDELACAARGNIEGVPCLWSAVSPVANRVGDATDLDPAYNPLAPDPLVDAEIGSRNVTVWDGVATGRFYVLALRAGATANSPGAYEPLASEWIYGSDFVLKQPINPSRDRWAGELMTPDPSGCTRPSVACGERVFDQRVPLENEITEDGDSFESSWRRLLTLARRASTEADSLGEQAIASSAEIEQASDAELQRLEDICGVSLSLDPLERLMAADPSATGIEALLSDPGALEADPQLARLAECVRDDAVRDYVTLGTDPVCVWYQHGDPNRLCEFDDADMPPTTPPAMATVSHPARALECPRRQTLFDVFAGGCLTPEDVSDPVEYTPVLIGEDPRDLLGYFDTPPSIESGDEESPPCEELRALRVAYNTGDMAAAGYVDSVFRDSDFFTVNKLKSIAPLIRWEASAGSHSTLFVNSEALTTTGTLEGGPSGQGICGTNMDLAADYSCPEGDAYSLLCNSVDCSDVTRRSELNARMAAAAGVARWLGQRDFQGFVVPSHRGWPSASKRDRETSVDAWFSSVMTYAAQTLSHKNNPGEVEWACNRDASNTEPLWRWHTGLFSADVIPGVPDTRFLDRQQQTSCGSNVIRFETWGADRYRHDTTSGENRRWTREQAADFVRRLREVDLTVNDEVLLNPIVQLFTGSGTSPPSRSVKVTCGLTPCDGEPELPWRADRGGGDDDNEQMAPFLSERSGFHAQALFDALEIMCESSNVGVTRWGCPADPPALLDDELIPFAAEGVECLGTAIADAGGAAIFARVPEAALDALREESGTGAFESVGGEYGQEVSNLRVELIALSAAPRELKRQLVGLGRDLRSVELAMRLNRNGEKLDTLAYRQSVNSAAASCAMSSQRIGANPASWSGPAQVCALALQNTVFASRRHRVQVDSSEARLLQSLLRFEEAVSTRSDALQAIGDRLVLAQERIEASTERLAEIRRRARRTLSRALWLDSDETGRVFRSNTVIRRRMNTVNVNYQRAREDAIHIAFLAKAAIEQRFGVRLEDLTDNMTLVDAPATWASGLCTMSGIDYARIRSQDPSAPEDFADDYIGNYVRKLELFVESYSHDFPFANGQDTAVVSMRDDLLGVRSVCAVASANMLSHSGDLTRGPDGVNPGWDVLDGRLDAAGELQANAVDVLALDDPADQPTSTNAVLGRPRPYRVTFGPQHPDCGGAPGPCPCETDPQCGWQAATAVGQVLTLEAGRYRLSWYARQPNMADTSKPDEAVFAFGETSGTTWTRSLPQSEPADGIWSRYRFIFEVSAEEPVSIRVQATAAIQGASIDVAGVMLEDVTTLTPAYDETLSPPAFEETSSEPVVEYEACEDTDGENFRDREWIRDCVRLCEAGFGVDCPPETSVTHCYREAEFTISQAAIDRGEVLALSGFARGNFNYRVDTLGVNFVGTASRTCADSSLPSTCFSNGFIPYSLRQVGPFEVRNYSGEDYRAPLFDGVIEHARGLAAERYLTNPLSGADRSQIDPYMQAQFRGRPLAGTYRLRVWEEPGVNFDGIEDVQIVLGYRFWTRND